LPGIKDVVDLVTTVTGLEGSLTLVHLQDHIMTATYNIQSVDTLVGRAVLARATANKLGQLHDLIIEPVRGDLAGISVRMADGSLRSVEYGEVYSFGPDAVMVNSDESALPQQNSPLKALPLAMNKLLGAEVITEGGKILGQVATVFVRLAEKPVLIYEIRSSLLDKLLGHTLFVPSSLGCAFSDDGARLVVANDTAEKAENSLDALAARLFGPLQGEDPVVIIRSRGY
jgi:uncharacterized protein YrrD